MNKQTIRAIKFVNVLRNVKGPVVGYGVISELAGYGADHQSQQRAAGQAAKLIDYACFISGLPMLATTRIMTAAGEVNEASFPDMWQSWKPEIVHAGAVYQWKPQDFDKIIAELTRLEHGATTCWAVAESRSLREPNFIRYNLHRRVWRELGNLLCDHE